MSAFHQLVLDTNVFVAAGFNPRGHAGERSPTAQIGPVIARGVDNAHAAGQAAALLDAQIAASAAALAGADMATHPAVAPWPASTLARRRAA